MASQYIFPCRYTDILYKYRDLYNISIHQNSKSYFVGISLLKDNRYHIIPQTKSLRGIYWVLIIHAMCHYLQLYNFDIINPTLHNDFYFVKKKKYRYGWVKNSEDKKTEWGWGFIWLSVISTCLTSARLWIQSPVPKHNKK